MPSGIDNAYPSGGQGVHGSYYPPSNVASSSSPPPVGYQPTASYYPSSYRVPPPPAQSSSRSHRESQSQFIPTPSEIANTYPSYPSAYRQISPPQHSPHTTGLYSSSGYQPQQNAYRSSVPIPGRISTSGTRPLMQSHPSSSTSPISPSAERFPCEKCGKTFSRSHDRKRHHETQHLPQPTIHRCRYCEKEFSRADSLKRHLDNGCDEMPQPTQTQ